MASLPIKKGHVFFVNFTITYLIEIAFSAFIILPVMVVYATVSYTHLDVYKRQIPIDSIFTPVKKVNYMVENTRVGNVTDYDRLSLEVWTNGGVTPEEAISYSAKILTDQLSLFVNLTAEDSVPEVSVEKDLSLIHISAI